MKLVKGKVLRKTVYLGILSPRCYPSKLPGRKCKGGVTSSSCSLQKVSLHVDFSVLTGGGGVGFGARDRMRGWSRVRVEWSRGMR